MLKRQRGDWHPAVFRRQSFALLHIPGNLIWRGRGVGNKAFAFPRIKKPELKGRFLTLGVQNWQSIGSAASQRRAIITARQPG